MQNVKRFVGFLISTLVLSVAVYAHQFEELNVTGFSKNVVGMYEIEIQDTVKDHQIVCALYNESGALLSSSPSFTSNLATKVFITYSGDDVDTAKCVMN